MDTLDLADLVLQDAEVYDGSGRASYRADVAVLDGRIVSVVQEAAGAGCQRPHGRHEVDVEGLALCPGLVDMRAHSDLALPRDPDHSGKIAQGVTLEVLGQDDVDVTWRSVGEYLDRLDHGADGEGIAVDTACLVPHGMVRASVLGDREDREATAQELGRMRELIAEGMREGAFGMSSGLVRAPGTYAGEDELVELCRVVAEYGGYWSPYGGSYDAADAATAYEASTAVARKADCPLHLPDAASEFGEDTSHPHPLALSARELSARPLAVEECVTRLTSRPAALLGLPDRGLVREGYRADLVLFDPATLTAAGEAPHALPVSFPYVLIDGRFVIEDGRRTDVLAGRPVRRERR